MTGCEFRLRNAGEAKIVNRSSSLPITSFAAIARWLGGIVEGGT